jgi:hypothetical protein
VRSALQVEAILLSTLKMTMTDDGNAQDWIRHNVGKWFKPTDNDSRRTYKPVSVYKTRLGGDSTWMVNVENDHHQQGVIPYSRMRTMEEVSGS